MISDSESGLRILRTTIESAMDIPLSITVTSAKRGDGKTEVAVGLARAFATAGYRTIVVDANAANPSVATTLGLGRLRTPAVLDESAVMSATKVTPFLDAASIADETLADASSTVALRSFMDALRGLYGVTVWDAGDAFTSSLALQCAAASEGTVIAVRFGRKPTPEDSRLVASIEQLGARILGVVPTECPPERGAARSGPRSMSFGKDFGDSELRRTGKSTA